jgi:hypothetical protein
MKLPPKNEVVRGFLAGCLLLVTAAASAQAPLSVSGKTFGVAVTAGTYPYANHGYFIVTTSDVGNSFQNIPINGTSAGNGSYSYFQTNTTTGIATFLDSALGQETVQLNFNTADSGQYYGSASAFPGAFQTGEFIMYFGQVPDSIVGKRVLITVQDGAYPFAARGTATF